METKIIYFAHGITYDNVDEKCSEWKQVELNDLGKEQAKALDETTKDLVIYEDHIDKPFPNGESLKDVEKRIADFIEYIKVEYPGKTIAVVAHRAP
ncbi:MAG: histidine phosphatase family protein [Bacilli bacterium]|nr:histidine phosphatase family protein [Bacilli bacterium]